jgi:SAM-dependent methyltransferase/methyltransferase-like protein
VAAAFSYDLVEYPSAALPEAHPGHLHAVARMFGLAPAPPDRSRVLEVGCGDGTHLIGCAVTMPGATLVGVDRSEAAVDRGNRMIAELGLTNVSLHAADLTTWEPPGGFDYALAHGLYSWVPAPVRDALMGLFARVLGPAGVAYVSYNTYPGCYVRRMVWEMMKFHTAGFADPAVRIGQATELLKFLSAGRSTRKDSGMALLSHELDNLLNDHDPRVLDHDDLGEVNDPVYVHEFVAHAARHGLRFVSEADAHTMETCGFPAEVAGVLDGLAEQDAVLREQYLDFLRVRRFRMTLLSPDPRRPLADPDPAGAKDLAVSGALTADPDPPDLGSRVPVTFKAGEAVARTDLPIAKAALVALAECDPQRVPFPELLDRAAAKLGRGPAPDDPDKLAELLTAVWMTGMIRFHGHVPRYATSASERPVASPLARLQARSGECVTTLLHATMRMDDAPSRRMLQMLDGTRDREQIAAELLAAFPQDKRPDPAALRAGIDRNLARLARAGLLVG